MNQNARYRKRECPHYFKRHSLLLIHSCYTPRPIPARNSNTPATSSLPYPVDVKQLSRTNKFEKKILSKPLVHLYQTFENNIEPFFTFSYLIHLIIFLFFSYMDILNFVLLVLIYFTALLLSLSKDIVFSVLFLHFHNAIGCLAIFANSLLSPNIQSG